jgi:hypothetical protein
MMNHLKNLGVEKERVFGDFVSWDTVSNAFVARMFVEAVMASRLTQEKGLKYQLHEYEKRKEEEKKGRGRRDEGKEKEIKNKEGDNMSFLPKLNIEVFISDFHADRTHAAFEWVFKLYPSIMQPPESSYPNHHQHFDVKLSINKVHSFGIHWSNENSFKQRIEHEAKGVQVIKENEKVIKTFEQFLAFMLLGGHKGLLNYLHSEYTVSKGGGWGGKRL